MKTKRLVQFTILISLILVPSLEVESFHDPFNTVAFPQFVAGQVGDLYYSPVMRVCSPGGFQGQFAVFRNDRSIPTSLLINELPYQGPVPIFLGAEDC